MVGSVDELGRFNCQISHPDNGTTWLNGRIQDSGDFSGAFRYSNGVWGTYLGTFTTESNGHLTGTFTELIDHVANQVVVDLAPGS